ncbi:MAG: MMPL family transporter [Gammaproteobacteria bacterium]|nr:MMPL family transporter [Gammaproteobacteria bacterium]
MPLSTAARWAIWLAILAAVCILAWIRLDARQPVNTDILALLPKAQQSPLIEAANSRSRELYADQLLILVSGADTPVTRDAALAAGKAASAAGLHMEDTGKTFNRLLRAYQKHHFALLDAAQINRLRQGGETAFASDVAASLASPADFAGTMRNDPGGYLGRYIRSLPGAGAGFLPDGPFLTAMRGTQRYYLLRFRLTGSAFSQGTSTQAANAVQAARIAADNTCSSCVFLATGTALYANASRIEAQREIQWLTLVSTLLIMGIIAYVFRSLAPHILAALQLLASVAVASAAVIICFGSIHILTLVAGTTLLGIAIDYAFLYFAEYWFGGDTPKNVMRHMGSGLYLGLLTGILGFAFMLFTGFPALDQIAVFSIAGMLEAGLVVVLIYPVTLTNTPKVAPHALVYWPQRFIHMACRPSRWRFWLPLVLLLLAMPGWLRLRASDDVRGLQHLPPQLAQTERSIHEILGESQPSGFYLVTAGNLEGALIKEEQLFSNMRSADPGAIPLGLSRFLPSMSLQRSSLAVWNTILGNSPALYAAFLHYGLPQQLATLAVNDWHRNPRLPLTANSVFAAAPELRDFVIPAGGNTALMATVAGDTSSLTPAILQKISGSVAGVSYIQPLQQIASIFRSIRLRATWLVVLGYLLISMLLILRYGRREAIRMLYAPLFALAVTLGTLGWLHVPVTIFVVVALILILGLGRDYAVFLREGGMRRTTALAVTLSALTTLCSFGLLSLSHIPALHAFGLTALIGILASYLSSPLSLPVLSEAST